MALAQSKRRPGFTLVEMLVVIAIVIVLATLAVTATFRVLYQQEESNTRTGMQAIYPILQKHWQKVVGDAKKEQPSQAVLSMAGVTTSSDSTATARAQVIWVKLRLMEAFPISYDEIVTSPLYNQIYTPTGTPYIEAGQRRNIASYQKKLGTTTGQTLRAQSAACLVMALSQNRGGLVLDEEKLGPFLRDSDGDGMKEFVDGWGTPIAFFRFPTAYPNLLSTAGTNWLNPAQTGRGATFSDPLDPDGLLQNGFTNQASFTSLVHPVAASVYITPALASSGPDGNLGLTITANSAGSTMAVSDAAQANDNVYSFFLKIGSTGN